MTWKPGDYCTLSDVRTDIGAISTSDDDMLENMIHDASREIDSYCARRFYAVGETRYYDAIADVDCVDLYLDDDLTYVTSITNGDGAVLLTTDYVLVPYNRNPKYLVRLKASSGKSWTYLSDPEKAIIVAGSWGYSPDLTPPDDIRRAAIGLVRWRYQQRQAPFEQAGQGDTGTYTVSSGIPSDIQRMLQPYRKMVFSAVAP
jgi:hypothetical protein